MELSILIVDDEESIRSAMATWFRLHGFRVTVAADGLEAVAFCKAQQFSIVTLDLEMPRMDGLEALLLIRKALPETPVLVLTGYPRDTDEALARGAVRVLVKPLTMQTLEAHIRELLPASETS